MLCALGLLNIQLSDGMLLIKGKKVTGFSNEDKNPVELDKVVPFLTENELVKRGAVHKNADQPWDPFALEDSRLLTGQNPASGGAAADFLIAALRTNRSFKNYDSSLRVWQCVSEMSFTNCP